MRAKILALLLPSLAVWGQNAPHLAYVYPAGGQRGTTFQVKVGGQFLNQVTGVRLTGSGVRASASGVERPMTPMEATQLREQVQELLKTPNAPAAQKQIVEIRRKLATFNRNRNPVLAEVETLEIGIAPDALPGRRELRLATPQGLSNPLVFCVGQLTEFSEKQSDVRIVMPGMTPEEIGAGEMRVALPVTVNGRIMPRPARQQAQQFTPGEADRYRFQAHKGEHLVIAVSARELIPYLADAVPGWFQPTVALLDEQGNELAYDDDYRFHPDPVLHYEIRADGEYVAEIKDALYRGREDFVYRVTIGDLPFVTSMFPLGGRAGAQTAVAVTGWNLPLKKVTMDARGKAPGVYPLPLKRAELDSNPAMLALDALPEALEKEPNMRFQSADEFKAALSNMIASPSPTETVVSPGVLSEETLRSSAASLPESVETPASRWNAARRQRGLCIAAGALLTLVAIVLIAVQLRNRSGATGNSPVVQPTKIEDSRQSTGTGISNPAFHSQSNFEISSTYACPHPSSYQPRFTYSRKLVCG